MSEMFYTQAPSNAGHGHFDNNNIDSFPDLHAPSTFDQTENFVRDALRYQILNLNPDRAIRCTPSCT